MCLDILPIHFGGGGGGINQNKAPPDKGLREEPGAMLIVVMVPNGIGA